MTLPASARALLVLSCVCVVAFAVAAAPWAAVSKPVVSAATTTPTKKPVPAKPKPTLTPAQLRAANLRAGAALFAANGCGACHTLAAAHGAGTAGPNLDLLGLPAAEIVKQLTKGSISMPSFKARLTAAQIGQLAGYVVATARARGTRPRDPATLFRGYCGTCHALAAAGTPGAVAPRLDGHSYTAADVQSAVVSGHPVSLGFGSHLDGSELQAIAAYVAAASPPAQPATTTGG